MRLERECLPSGLLRSKRPVGDWASDANPRWEQFPNKGYRARTEPLESSEAWDGTWQEPAPQPWQLKTIEPSDLADPLTPRPPTPSSPLDKAYESLDKLLVRRHLRGSSPELETEIEAAWAHLRELQEAQIRTAERTLEASFALPPSELERLTREARALLDADDGE